MAIIPCLNYQPSLLVGMKNAKEYGMSFLIPSTTPSTEFPGHTLDSVLSSLDSSQFLDTIPDSNGPGIRESSSSTFYHLNHHPHCWYAGHTFRDSQVPPFRHSTQVMTQFMILPHAPATQVLDHLFIFMGKHLVVVLAGGGLVVTVSSASLINVTLFMLHVSLVSCEF